MSDFYARLFHQNERVIKLGLDAIHAALERENHIVNYPHILVAGTNGKGQCSALWATALHRAGLQTGLFTSPHLVEFRERMRVNGELVPETEIIEIGNQVLSDFGGESPKSGIALTYFECCLMMALRLYQKKHVQFGVFEVGLGGRLDATNALSPCLSIITSIGLDHTEYLGKDTHQIAREKAGIMRQGCPVVAGRTEVDTLRRESLDRRCASFEALGVDFDWKIQNHRVVLESNLGSLEMHGAENMPDFQRDNAAVALFALLRAQQNQSIPRIQEQLPDLIPHTQWVGRMWTCSPPCAQRYGVHQIILDGAHNVDGVKAFVNAAKKNPLPKALLVNSCADKNIDAMFPCYNAAFQPQNIFIVPIHATPRAMSPIGYCHRVHLPTTQACHDLDEGLQRAAHAVGPHGTLYISGSLYLIGEALQWLDDVSALQNIEIPN